VATCAAFPRLRGRTAGHGDPGAGGGAGLGHPLGATRVDATGDVEFGRTQQASGTCAVRVVVAVGGDDLVRPLLLPSAASPLIAGGGDPLYVLANQFVKELGGYVVLNAIGR